jgi:hypothetical protein
MPHQLVLKGKASFGAVETNRLTINNEEVTAGGGGSGDVSADEENTFAAPQTFQIVDPLPQLGADILTNGEFTSNLSGWTAGTNWGWSAGSARHTAGVDDTLEQEVTATEDAVYMLTAKISGATAGWVEIYFNSNWPVDIYQDLGDGGANGIYHVAFVASSSDTDTLIIDGGDAFDGSIDYVRVQPVEGNIAAPVTIADADGNPVIEVRSSTEDDDNTFVGLNSGGVHYGGARNTTLGAHTMEASVSDFNNTAIGNQALRNLRGGGDNVAVGESAMLNSNGVSNNIAIGRNAMSANEGNHNVGIGTDSLSVDGPAYHNVAVGTETLQANTGAGNIGIGYQALKNLGNYNSTVAVGAGAGINSEGSGCIYIGTDSGANNEDDNRLLIGNDPSTPLIFGVMGGNPTTQVVKFNALVVWMPYLPTSPSGLSAGMLWVDTDAGNALKVVVA